jgi:hypothetical protein
MKGAPLAKLFKQLEKKDGYAADAIEDLVAVFGSYLKPPRLVERTVQLDDDNSYTATLAEAHWTAIRDAQPSVSKVMKVLVKLLRKFNAAAMEAHADIKKAIEPPRGNRSKDPLNCAVSPVPVLGACHFADGSCVDNLSCPDCQQLQGIQWVANRPCRHTP